MVHPGGMTHRVAVVRGRDGEGRRVFFIFGSLKLPFYMGNEITLKIWSAPIHYAQTVYGPTQVRGTAESGIRPTETVSPHSSTDFELFQN